MTSTTISEAGAHATAAATMRIPALASPHDATGKGYTTPLQILGGLAYVDVASATTTDIGAAASDKVRITGTTTITGLGTVASGTRRSVRFAAALTLTHNATSLILPGAANITTAADDTAEFDSLGSGNWICTSYKRADGMAPLTGTGWATILATTPPYIPIYPTGVAATDTAAVAAALTEANSTKKPIEVQRNGTTLRLNSGNSVLSDVRYIGNGVTHEIQVGSGGFNSTDRADKFNANGQNTCLFYMLARENVEFHDIVFTASASTERLVQLIQARDGFDTSQFRVSNIFVRNMNVQSGGGLIGAHSLGEGAFLLEDLRGLTCSISGTTWSGGTPQLTLAEMDSDLVSSTPSRPGGTIRRARVKDFLFSGSAVSTYGQQTDLVTLAGVTLTEKSLAHYVEDLFADGVGEVLDCFANGARISNIRGENCIYVLKLIHGARYCTANNISGRALGRDSTAGALITIAGTGTASSGDTMNNVISGCTVETFGVNDSCGVLFQQNTGTVGVPKRNTILGLRVLGDSNGDHYVKDNCTTDADNDNRVYMIDGSAAGTKTVSIVHADNTKVHAVNRAHTQISLGANQDVSTLATLDFSVATIDPEGIADTANDKVTVKWPGLYLVEIGLRFSSNLDDQDTVEIRCVGGGKTQTTRTTIGKSAEEDTIRASFHVLVVEQDIGGANADIYAQCAVEGASNATVVTTVDRTGMWLTRVG